MKHFFILLFCFVVLGCNAQIPTRELRLDATHLVLLFDSTDAAKAITTDRGDLFFERVNASEMSIQMKQPLATGQTREIILPAYVEFLKGDVESFTADEANFTVEVMKKVFKTANKIAPGIFPDSIKLIKTKSKHYGAGVWYTRDNCIVIPAGELTARRTNSFTTTMYHELFHVYSRLNPTKREKLYRLIGFEKVGLEKLQLPPALAERVLYNPDGVDFAQKITLKLADSAQIAAVPIIYAKNVGAKAGQSEFFGYLEFNLFQIQPNNDGSWKVVTKDDGFSSTLNLNELPDFFHQIKDNTGYIIHPDEVLADNFSFIMIGKNNPTYTAKFSATGKQLLADVEAILKEK